MYLDLLKPVSIIQKQDGEYEYQAHLPESGATILFNDAAQTYNHLTAVKIADQLLSFSLLGASPTTTITGTNFVIYPDVFPGVDLFYDVKNNQLKEGLVITSPDCRQEFTFDLIQENISPVLQADNSIFYYDLDGKHIWTIEAPYAFDANGNNVTSYISLDGDKYTIGITPTADTVFPVTLDPTVTLTFSNWLFWNTQDVIQTSTIPTTRVVIGRSGSNPIKNITVYNERATKKISNYVKTNYTNNSSTMVRTYYQFFDSTGTALDIKQNLIVASGTYIGTITVPSGAYYIEFSGIADGVSNISVFNVLKITAIEYQDYYSHWYFTPKTMTNYGKNIVCTFPETWFNISMADVAGSTTIEAPPGDTFVAKSYSVIYSRDYYGYLLSPYCDLYNAAGTLISSTLISTPSAPVSGSTTVKATTVVVPAGITKITLRATIKASSISSSSSKVYATFNTNIDDYGTASYAITLASDVTDASVSPGFYPQPTINPIKTYVSLSSTNNYVEANTITATAGTVANIKVSFTAPETNTTQCNNICLSMAPANTSVTITTDTNRSINTAINFAADTKRNTAVIADLTADTNRDINTAQNITADTYRIPHASINSNYDSARKTTVNDSVLFDTVAAKIKSSAINYDTKRNLSANQSIVYDSIRKTVKSAFINSDTIRKSSVTAIPKADSKRLITKSVMNFYDLIRRHNVTANINYDSIRKTTKSLSINSDTKRQLIKSAFLIADSKRNITNAITTKYDLKRELQKTISILADTKRFIGVSMQGLAYCDTTRQIIKSTSLTADTTRKIKSLINTIYDTSRFSAANYSFNSDTKRKIGNATSANFDTKRVIAKLIIKFGDTNRKTIAFIISASDTSRKLYGPISVIFDTLREISLEENMIIIVYANPTDFIIIMP